MRQGVGASEAVLVCVQECGMDIDAQDKWVWIHALLAALFYCSLRVQGATALQWSREESTTLLLVQLGASTVQVCDVPVVGAMLACVVSQHQSLIPCAAG